MTNPITPPPELVEQWEAETAHTTKDEIWHVAVQAAQWGADQELEACIEWIAGRDWTWTSAQLRTARRPNPPSLKEQALAVLEEEPEAAKELLVFDTDQVNLIRRALNELPDN